MTDATESLRNALAAVTRLQATLEAATTVLAKAKQAHDRATKLMQQPRKVGVRRVRQPSMKDFEAKLPSSSEVTGIRHRLLS